MTESEFNQQVEDTLVAIEESLDDYEDSLEYENNGGILTIQLSNGSQVIVNRQIAALQLWVAAKSGGFHFNYDETSGWIDDKSGDSLSALLSRCLSEQSGDTIKIQLDV